MTWTLTLYALNAYIEIRKKQGLNPFSFTLKEFHDWLVENELFFVLSHENGGCD